MQAKIILPGSWKLSKQNSYCAGRNGSLFKNPAYADEQKRMQLAIKPQLDAQSWKCAVGPVAMVVIFNGPKMPVDFDNYGLLVDALQGPTKIIGRKRVKCEGLVVIDDRQFVTVLTHWNESKTKSIELFFYAGQNWVDFVDSLKIP